MKKSLKLIAILVAVMMMFVLVGCGSKTAETTEPAETETTEEVKEEAPAPAVGTAKDGNEVDIETAAMNLVAAKEAGGYDLVNTETMKEWVDKGEDMIVIDTMPAESFAAKRIPGAVNAVLPLTKDELTDEERAAFVEKLGTDKDKKIVVYCGFVKCGRSNVGALIAKEEGFTNVVRYPGGIVAWEDAGYDMESDN